MDSCGGIVTGEFSDENLFNFDSKDSSLNVSKGDIVKEIYENNLNADSPRVIFPSKVCMPQKTENKMPSTTVLPKLDLHRLFNKNPTTKNNKVEIAQNKDNSFIKNFNTTVLKKSDNNLNNNKEKELVHKIENLTKELNASNQKIEELKNKLEKYKKNYKEMKSKTHKLKDNLKLANNKIELLKIQIKKFEKIKPQKKKAYDNSFDELDDDSSFDISINELDLDKYSERIIPK
jgi:predicted RNase H-like nuclease (RuvC/YqgF family)